jgi:hypothetical protein
MSSNQNKASGYSGGGKSGKRGTGNRKFVRKSNANTDKGLIEELPLLNIRSGAVAAPEPEWWQKEEWKDQCKRVSDSNAKFRDDKLIIYALILGQCADSMRQKLSAQQDWAAASLAEDSVALLGLGNQLCMTFGAHSAEKKGYHTSKHSKYESLGGYRKRFDAAVQTMVQSGLQQNQLPDDEAMAVTFIKALEIDSVSLS